MNDNETLFSELPHSELTFKVLEIENPQSSRYAMRITGGAILLCTSGTARIAVLTHQYDLSAGSEVILLDDAALSIISCSTDFRLVLLIYSWDIALQATFKFPSTFFNYVIGHPVLHHREGSETITLGYMNILRHLQADTHNHYQMLMATNTIRNMMLNAYDKMQRRADWHGHNASSRKEELFGRFMDLVIEHARHHRDIAYYADRLCITPKYLADVTRAVNNESPKSTIDNFLIADIKLMLTYSNMSIQQIADYLHFPSHSNFGRYFKQRTGISPGAYRELEGIVMSQNVKERGVEV